MDPISSFAISYAAGIALDLWNISQQTVDKEIKKAFNEALKDWCPNSQIRVQKKNELKKEFLIIAYKPESFSEDYRCYGEYEKFYILFDKRISQHQVAYNHIKSIQDSARYRNEIAMLSNVSSVVKDTNEKVTQLLDKAKTESEIAIDSVKVSTRSKVNSRKVLFNNYTKDVEPFYHKRNIDNQVVSSLASGNIWLYGSSGIGKTALINRNLIQNSIEYVYCDFSPIEISSAQDVLEEIILIVSEKYNIISENNAKNKIKRTCDILSKIDSKEIVIVIDELSIKDSILLKDITEQLIKLLNHHYNKSNETAIRFIASTIGEPTFDKNFVGKALEYFEFIEMANWNGDLEKLLTLLYTALGLTLNDEMKELIIQNSKSSPRLLKKILRKLYSYESLNQSIVQVESEKIRKEHF